MSKNDKNDTGSNLGVTRETKSIDGLDECRIYTSQEGDRFPSVTTVIDKFRHDPQKERALKYWRRKYDGQGGREHHSDILKVKSHFGTLAHYYTLSSFTQDDLWGEAEENAKQALQDHGEYEGVDAWEWAQNRFGYVKNNFHKELEAEDIVDVIGVENFVVDCEVGYAGQYDLLYTRDGPSGKETVLCDLKTGSGIRTDDELQTVAYAHSIARDIDKIKIVRADANSSGGEFEVRTSDEFCSSCDDLFSEFEGYVRSFHRRMKSMGDNPYSDKNDKQNINFTADENGEDENHKSLSEEVTEIVDTYTGAPYGMSNLIQDEIEMGRVPKIVLDETNRAICKNDDKVIEIIEEYIE